MNSINISVDFEDKSSVQQGLLHFNKEMAKYFRYEYSLGKDYVCITGVEEELYFYDFLSYPTCEKFYVVNHCVFTDDTIADDDLSIYYSVVSQVCLVQKALEYGFEKEVVELAKNIVRFVRSTKDYTTLKYQEDVFFGFNLLYTLAFNKPQYSYLMSEYLPDEPTNEMTYFDKCFSRVYEKHGLSKDILFAISYLNYAKLAGLSEGGFLNLYFDDMRKFKDINRIYRRLKTDNEAYDLLKGYLVENFKNNPSSTNKQKHLVEQYFEVLLYKEVLEEGIKEDIKTLIQRYESIKKERK